MKHLLAPTLLATILSLWLTAAAWAGFDEGVAAYNRGDYKTAIEEWLPVAEQGNARAQNMLGLMYRNGEGVAQDYAEAVKWYRLAAEQGDATAQYNLGLMYRNGEDVAQDDAEAVKWYRLAAEQGHASAQYNLGFMYKNGEGVPQDYAEAVKWYRLAAAQGQANAQYNLGNAYRTGSGVAQDYAEAVKWYRLAAAQGRAPAQYNLGVMYDYGEGVPQDYIQAHMWYNLAAAQGYENGRKNRDLLAKEMTPAQLAEAQRMAREWRPTTTQDNGSASTATEPRASTTTKLKLYATGSGFAVSSAGHVLTNDHVVNGCREVRVPPATVVRIVATDAQTDLALLKISGTPLIPATFRQGRGIRPGDPVVVAGFPLQGVLTSDLNITTGNVSALAGPGNDRRLMQVTAPVQPGNSGGPLLDLSGNVVGVVVSKLDAVKLAELTGDIPQNVNFVISAGVTRAFLDAYDVPYETAKSLQQLDAATVASRARGFTLLIECWR